MQCVHKRLYHFKATTKMFHVRAIVINRPAARKFSVGELCVCVGGLVNVKIDKNFTDP